MKDESRVHEVKVGMMASARPWPTGKVVRGTVVELDGDHAVLGVGPSRLARVRVPVGDLFDLEAA